LTHHPEGDHSEPVAYKSAELKKCLESRPGAEALARIYIMKKLYPDNLAIKHFDFEYYHSLSPAEQEGLLLVHCTTFLLPTLPPKPSPRVPLLQTTTLSPSPC
jgi:hypothetical protein